MRPRNPWRVAALAYDGLCTFEFGVVVEVFGLPRPELEPWYDFRVCAVERGPLRATGGVFVEAKCGLGALDHAGTVLVPGWRTADERPPRALLTKLRRAHDEGARLVSVCSGAFLLAEAGLLDGRRATTHWRYAQTLAERFPAVRVDPDVLYVDEDDVLTSAGSAAGIDLCLHLVRRDCGASVANAVARRLVVPPHRDGGQLQFIDAPLGAETDAEQLAGVLEKVRAGLQRPHSVASMARLARLSERTFARRFRAVTGTTPHRWLVRERVQRAQHLLETADVPLERVAAACGFADTQLLRLHFKRLVGTPPGTYRRAFRKAADAT